MEEKVSVIVPCYNSELFLESCVDSVLSQRYQNIELICVDDNSNDGTWSLLQEMSAKDVRIKVLQNPGKGVASARNLGIQFASGRYIAFLDSDDFWFPNKLYHQINHMIKNKAALSHTSYVRVSEDDGKQEIRHCRSRENLNSMLKNNGMGCSTVIYDTRLLGKVFMPNLTKRQDWATWLRILSEKPDNVSYGLDEVLTRYTIRSGSVSSTRYDLVFYTFLVYRSLGLNVLESILRTIEYTIKKVRNRI